MILAQMFTQTVSVETYTGSGEFGDVYASPVDVLGMLDDGLVLTKGPAGDLLTSSTVFYTYLENAPLFRPESRVSINGVTMQVEAAKPRQAAPMFRQLEHLEVQLK